MLTRARYTAAPTPSPGPWPVNGPDGGGGRLFALGGLPADVREALARQTAGYAAVGRGLGRELGAQAEYDDAAGAEARALGLGRYQRLSDNERARADARAALVRACREYTRAAGLSTTRGRALFAAEYNAGRIEVAASVRAALHSVSAGSLKNWDKTLTHEGLAALAGEYGKHRKGAGCIDSDPDLREFCLGMITEYPHCSAKHVMRGIEARFVPERRPSQRVVQRWLKTWKEENEQLYCDVTNPDRWRSKYKAAAGDASAKATRLNQYWEYDSTKGDVFLADGKRHVVVGVIDIYSRRAKLLVSRTSCSAAICSLTRKALFQWGVPEVAVTDNGADYVSKQMVRVFLGLDIRHHQTNPFSPEEKPFIERLFGTFCRDLVELLPGYSGHSVADAKNLEAQRSFAQRLNQKGGTLDLSRMSVAEFQAFCDEWTDNIYQHDVHASLGKTPWQMASEWAQPIQRIQDERALDVLLLPAPKNDGWCTVQKKAVAAAGGKYNHSMLGGLEGTQVRVLLDDADAGYAYIFQEDGEYLCRAEDPDLTGTSRAEIAAQRKARQKALLAEQKKELRAAAKRANVKDIAREIRQHRAAEAGKLSRLPQQSTPYSTGALEQAGIAARDGDAPPLESPVNAAAREQLKGTATVLQLPDSPRQRWNRWAAVDAALGRGEAVPDADKDFHRTYQSTADWASWRDLMDWKPVAAAQ